jgi:plastocyanin
MSYGVVAADITIKVLDKNNKPLADMVVYLQSEANLSLPLNENIVEVGQFDRSFTPYISVMQLGNKVNFKNKDDITHHIYSPIGENKFSYKISAGQSQIKSDFEQAGEVAMGCNIHDWMSGYLLIVDTPIFGKTDKNGQLNLTVQHSGEYKLVVWHPQLDALDNRFYQQVQLSEDKAITVKLDNKILKISEQKNEEDFDFLSDY